MPPTESSSSSSCYYAADRTAHCVPRGEHVVFMGDSITRVSRATALQPAAALRGRV